MLDWERAGPSRRSDLSRRLTSSPLRRGRWAVGKMILSVVLAVVGAVVSLLVLVAAIAGGAVSGGAGTSAGGSPPDTAGRGSAPAVPTAWVHLDQQAAAACPGLPWSVLAAVGTVESASGQSDAPGVWSGANAAGAEGPMQFEPATFAAYATAGPGGAVPATPYDPVDAVYTATTMLCRNGAGAPEALAGALFAYDHSEPYVRTVLTLALALGDDPATSATVVDALTFAAGQLGVPYQWGGTGPGGFDCSGLAQAAYGHTGVALPRVAQDQYDAGPVVPAGAPVRPGDLLFFGSGPGGVDHVGIYVGGGEMVDAPFTGALVRFDTADWSGLVGATQPA